VQLCFDFYMIEAKPENLIGDRAYDSDPLDEELRRDPVRKGASGRSLGLKARPRISLDRGSRPPVKNETIYFKLLNFLSLRQLAKPKTEGPEIGSLAAALAIQTPVGMPQPVSGTQNGSWSSSVPLVRTVYLAFPFARDASSRVKVFASPERR
jgi:hypothetical protein